MFRFLIVLIVSSNIGFSQLATGKWRMHIANKAIGIATGANKVFVAYESGLLEYDTESKEITTWTDVNSLSDIFVASIYFHEGNNSFYVGYTNGNIDKIKDNVVTNIPAIKLANLQGDKKVYSFSSDENYVYACTGLGIVLLNPNNNEVKDTYYPNTNSEPILEIAFHNDSIFAVSHKNVWKGKKASSNLSDPQQWNQTSIIPTIFETTKNYKNIFSVNNKLYVSKLNTAYGLDSLYEVTPNGLNSVIAVEFNLEFSNIRKDKDRIIVVFNEGILHYNFDIELIGVNNTFPGFSQIEITCGTILNGKVYLGDVFSGLIEIDGYDIKSLKQEGPYKNSFFALGGYEDKITVAGGLYRAATINYNTSGAYVFENETWTKFDNTSRTDTMSRNIFDVSSVSVNPKNTKEIAISSFSQIPLYISKDELLLTEYYTDKNSILEGYTDLNDLICVSNSQYDSQGNLWIVNCLTSNPLKVKTKDNLWYKYPIASEIHGKYTGRLIFDNNNNKWFSVREKGIVGFNDNGTIEDPSDDKYVIINEGANTGALPDADVTAMAVDYDNELWIGTSSGFAILYNPEGAFDALPGEYNTQRIKIDFEGNVEYLLGNTSITDIEVDGGNRKWMGTANAGIFLLSADGTEVIENYTKENSDLLSNNIVDMHFNTKTGELFVITDVGLVSLRTNSSTGDDKYENVIVFPNPVKPEFNGQITIQGIKYDSDVKFTDIAGNVVYQTTSNGGTATWNGKNYAGEKVKSGTYLIWTASNTEKGRRVGKVVILN